MIKRKTFAGFALIAIIAFVLVSINGCKTDTNPQPLEPISIVQPDTPITMHFGGDSFPIKIKFTTDRPINWIMGKVDVDTLIDTTNYVPTFPDTLFFKNLTTLNPRQNLYTYDTTYYVASNLRPFSVITFLVSFQAGSTTFETGQNYPAGVVSYSKQFIVNIR
jgi:hypothetical protein